MNHVERSSEVAAHLRAGHRHVRVVGGDELHGLDAAGGAGRGLQVGDRSCDLHLLRELRRVEQHRAPVVVGRQRVVGVVHRDEVRDRVTGRLERRRRAAARSREEERVGDLPVVEDHLSLRRVDRVARRRELGVDPAVDLVACVAVEIEGAALREVRERVGAGCDRLRLQRLGRPVRRHLRRDDALQVRLETDRVDDLQVLSVARDGDLPAIRLAVDDERLPADEAERRLQGEMPADREVRAQGEHAGVERHLRARRIGDAPVDGRVQRRLLLLGQEHAHGGELRGAERRPRVVVSEDPVVRPAVLRVAVRAPLAQPQPVPPAVAADDEHGRSGARDDTRRRATTGRRGCRRRRTDGCPLTGSEERSSEAAEQQRAEQAQPEKRTASAPWGPP